MKLKKDLSAQIQEKKKKKKEEASRGIIKVTILYFL